MVLALQVAADCFDVEAHRALLGELLGTRFLLLLRLVLASVCFSRVCPNLFYLLAQVVPPLVFSEDVPLHVSGFVKQGLFPDSLHVAFN